MSSAQRPDEPAVLHGTQARAARAVAGEIDRDWVERAACRGHRRPNIFYPPAARADDVDEGEDLSKVKRSKRERRRRIIVAEAKSVCRTCPVRAKNWPDPDNGGTGECLDYAEAYQDYHGIWGGLTARERGRKRDER
jgi:WhiB family redox-sensing transcriptional regulator